MAKRQIEIGSLVRLTAKHLRSTGQYTAGPANSRWRVTGFSGNFAVTNERLSAGFYTAEEIAAEPALAFRMIHVGNLEAV